MKPQRIVRRLCQCLLKTENYLTTLWLFGLFCLVVYKQSSISVQNSVPEPPENDVIQDVVTFLPAVHPDPTVSSKPTSHLSSTTTKSNQNFVTSALCKRCKSLPVGPSGTEKLLEMKWCSDESSLRGQHQKVFAYSFHISGDEADAQLKRYSTQLKDISKTVHKDFPDWVVRIYHNLDTASLESGKSTQAGTMLCDLYCQNTNVDLCSVPVAAENLVDHPHGSLTPTLLRNLHKKMYHHISLLDPNVDVFASRDRSALIWPREVAAVQEWLDSNYTFHVMRDSPSHNIVILAGLFGVKLSQKRKTIQKLAEDLIVFGQDHYVEQHQLAATNIVWPVAKDDVMAHDSYQCENKAILDQSPTKIFPFPKRRESGYYVGSAQQRIEIERWQQHCPKACRPPEHQNWDFC